MRRRRRTRGGEEKSSVAASIAEEGQVGIEGEENKKT